MISAAKTLPDNIEDLKEIAHRYEVENNILRERVRLLRAQLFGRKTEKRSLDMDNGQTLLFNEAETFSSVEEAVKEVLKEGKYRTKDLGGTSSTSEVGDAVVGAIEKTKM